MRAASNENPYDPIFALTPFSPMRLRQKPLSWGFRPAVINVAQGP